MDDCSFLASLTVSEFRQFKKALRVLLTANVPFSVAVQILQSAHYDRRSRISERRPTAFKS